MTTSPTVSEPADDAGTPLIDPAQPVAAPALLCDPPVLSDPAGVSAEAVEADLRYAELIDSGLMADVSDEPGSISLLVDESDDILLISRQGMSLRFTADDESLRPMGRSTEGVKAMTFREGDSLLSASVAGTDGFVFVVTEGGYAKRISIDQYRVQGRGGLGIKVAKLSDDRGDLAGGLIVGEDDEVLVVLASGKVVRSAVAEVPAKGRDTMGVVFARLGGDDKILAIARNSERGLAEEAEESDAADADPETPQESTEA